MTVQKENPKLEEYKRQQERELEARRLRRALWLATVLTIIFIIVYVGSNSVSH